MTSPSRKKLSNAIEADALEKTQLSLLKIKHFEKQHTFSTIN